MTTKQLTGFALLRSPQAVVTAHEAFIARAWGADCAVRYLEQLGSALSFVERSSYRGISRDPLEPNEKGSAAAQRFRAMVGSRASDDYDESLVPDLESAVELQGLLDSPEGYEILKLEREPFVTTTGIVGYDVGYWGGDHFSLIADTVVTPTWHPAPVSQFASVAERLRVLNEHVLFCTAEDATTFRDFYISQPWAEGEMPEATFQIIQISEPAEPS